MLSHIYCDVLLAVLSANSESVINYMLLIIIMIISKAQVLKKPSVLYKEHDGRYYLYKNQTSKVKMKHIHRVTHRHSHTDTLPPSPRVPHAHMISNSAE